MGDLNRDTAGTSMSATAEIKSERDLVRIAPKLAADYESVALTSLTAYSLYWLHTWELRRTIEAIAILNWRLFPEKFAMVGFHEYPDAFRTNRSLLQMQPKYRNLLTGAAVHGFSLNDRGMDIARELSGKFGVPTTGEGLALGTHEAAAPSARSNKPARSIEPKREIEKIRASRLFEKWKSGVMSDRDLIHVHAMLGIFDHTPTPVRRRVMKDLEKSAGAIKDGEALKFLEEVRAIFPQARLG